MRRAWPAALAIVAAAACRGGGERQVTVLGVWGGAELAAFREVVAPYAGRRVTCGIRPEAFGRGDAVIEAQLELCEPLGHETLLHLRVGGQILVSRTGLAEASAPGARVLLRADPADLHFFDPATGLAIARASRP